MTAHVVLEATGLGIRAAILDENRLIEIRDGDVAETRVTDALFAARVTAVDPKLNAAFLDCGLPQPGLLVAKDARAAAGRAERRPIRDLLAEGQRLVVQGLREPVEGKGARFTSDVKLVGMAVVHTPLTANLEGTRQTGRRSADSLRERSHALFPDGRFALRRHAADLDDAALRAEADALARAWQSTVATARNAKPGRLPEHESPLARLLRGLVDLAPASIAVADPPLLLELERLLTSQPTAPRVELIRLSPDEPAFAQTGVDAELEQALARDVPLPGNGRLRIEPTATCIAIDVDGGGRAALEVDLAAVPEIARQVRLRNLGGTIIVDFVDLPTKAERQRLEDTLKRAFRHDPAPVDIHPMTPLGIVQISRARRGEPLAARFVTLCACCGGTGQQPSARAGVERLLGELRRGKQPIERIRLARDLSDYLLGPAKPAWQHACERLGYTPPLTVDGALAPATFSIDERHHARY